MASNNTTLKIKEQTGKQKKARDVILPFETESRLEKPLSESAYNKLAEHINSLDADKLIKNNYVNSDLCNINSFRGRINTKLDQIVVAPTKDVIGCEELKNIFKNIEEIPLIFQKKKSKKTRDPDDGNMISSSTTLSTTSLNCTLAATKGNTSKSNKILMDYKGIKFEEAEHYLHVYVESKKKMNELFPDEKSLEAQNSQLHSYYEQVKKLHKVLDDFGKIVQKGDNAKEVNYAFTTEQEKIIELISDTIEQYFFIQENHHILHMNDSYENNYSYEELEQLTDVVTELLQNLN